MSAPARPTAQNHRDLQTQIRTKLGTLLQHVQAAPDLDTQAIRASIAQITQQSQAVRDFLANLEDRLRQLRDEIQEQRTLLDEWYQTGQASNQQITQLEQNLGTKLQALTDLQNLMADLQQLQGIVDDQRRIIQGINGNGGPGGPGGPGGNGGPPRPPGGSGGTWGQRPASGVVVPGQNMPNVPARAPMPDAPTQTPGSRTGIRTEATLQPMVARGGWRIPKMRSRSRARQVKTHNKKKKGKGRGRKTRRNKKHNK